MYVRKRQLVYGSSFGVATFLVGWIITYLLTPTDFLSEFPRWKTTLWIFLCAHFVQISGLQLGGIGAAFTEVDLISQLPTLRSLRVVPILLTALGGVLMIEVVNYTTRFRYLIQNSGSLLIGYLTAGFLAFIVSEAQPGVALIVVFGVVLGGAAYIGGTVTHRLTGDLPVFGVASVGGIVLVGLTIIVGGFTVLRAIGPLVAVSVVGVCFGSVMAWIARNVPT